MPAWRSGPGATPARGRETVGEPGSSKYDSKLLRWATPASARYFPASAPSPAPTASPSVRIEGDREVGGAAGSGAVAGRASSASRKASGSAATAARRSRAAIVRGRRNPASVEPDRPADLALRDIEVFGLDHHVGRPGAIERGHGAKAEGAGLASGQDALVVGRLHPSGVPIRQGNVVEDPCRRRRLVGGSVLDAQEEDRSLGSSVLAVGAVDQRVGPTPGGETVGPQALDPTETPEAAGDVAEGRRGRRGMRRAGDGAVLAALDEDGRLGAAEDVVGAVQPRRRGLASGDEAGGGEGLDVILGPMAGGGN